MKQHILIGFIMLLAITFGLWYCRQPEYHGISADDSLIQQLQGENELLRSKNLVLDSTLIRVAQSRDSLQRAINNNQRIIHNLKQEKNEKHQIITNYASGQLFKFFSGLDSIHHHP